MMFFGIATGKEKHYVPANVKNAYVSKDYAAERRQNHNRNNALRAFCLHWNLG